MNTTFLIERPFAHRGYFDNEKLPENSMPAFRKALRYGYNIELDVHLTKDNKLVVFHDNNLKRVCGVNKIIEDCTYDELLKYNLFNTNYKIPLFCDVLKLVNGKVALLIETKVIKCGKLEEELCKYLDDYKGFFAIQSFNPFSIYWFKKHRKNYIRGILSGDFKHNKNISNLRKIIMKTLIIDVILKTDFIAYDIRALPCGYVESKIKRKVVLGWTVRDKNDYDKSKKYCNNFIGENMNEYY